MTTQQRPPAAGQTAAQARQAQGTHPWQSAEFAVNWVNPMNLNSVLPCHVRLLDGFDHLDHCADPRPQSTEVHAPADSAYGHSNAHSAAAQARRQPRQIVQTLGFTGVCRAAAGGDRPRGGVAQGDVPCGGVCQGDDPLGSMWPLLEGHCLLDGGWLWGGLASCPV